MVTPSSDICNSHDVFPGSRVSVYQYQSVNYPALQAAKDIPPNFIEEPLLLITAVDVDTHYQLFLNSGEICMAKWDFECIAALYNVSIQTYFGNNVVFKSAKFQEDRVPCQQ